MSRAARTPLPTTNADARWRRWLSVALRDRGIPPDALVELELRPHGEVAAARLSMDLRWEEEGAARHAHVDVLVPLCRVTGEGWSGWPAYLAALKLLRALG